MVRTHQPDQGVFRSVLPEEIDWKPFPAFPPHRHDWLSLWVSPPSPAPTVSGSKCRPT
jgi:hypothetical protein